MTKEETQTNTLQNWWTNSDFSGKELCELKDNGELVLKATPSHPERTLAVLNSTDIADAALKALLEKFPEIQERVKEVSDEWEKTEDKLKLISKVTRIKDYLLHTNAIGDFHKLLEQVKGWEKVIAELIEQNYLAKLALVEKAETIATTGTSWKEATQTLRDISETWKSLGHVEKGRNEALWNRLEDSRNKFFERKRDFQDEQEKELLRNLDLKMEIVEKAEAVADSENWKETTEIFKKLMDQWRTIGRTAHDRNEELWGRFILSKNNFFQRKKDHFDIIQQEQEQNYIQKLALVEKAESLKDNTDWNKTTQAYAEIFEKWKSIGKVPNDKNDDISGRMNAAKDFFFNNKRQHNESIRVEQEDNYAQKNALLKRAESIKNSNNWKETTDEMNELLTEWKKIGLVPREFIHSLWDQFLAARKYFFNRKDEEREKRKQIVEKQIQSKFDKTKTFLEQLEIELKEETERLVEFKTALENVTPGNKEAELKSHLQKLISQAEYKIKHKAEKIDEIKKQFKDLSKMQPQNQDEKPSQAPEQTPPTEAEA